MLKLELKLGSESYKMVRGNMTMFIPRLKIHVVHVDSRFLHGSFLPSTGVGIFSSKNAARNVDNPKGLFIDNTYTLVGGNNDMGVFFYDFQFSRMRDLFIDELIEGLCRWGTHWSGFSEDPKTILKVNPSRTRIRVETTSTEFHPVHAY